MAGALPGRSYLAKLEAAGFAEAAVVGATGYVTSRYTAAHRVTARKPPGPLGEAARGTAS